METTCGSLLSELQKRWDEIGEPDSERDQMLFELEQECLEAYQRKVDQASHCRAQMRQSLADSEAQVVDICAALGERPVCITKDQKKLQGPLITEQEATFGSKQSPSKSVNKNSRPSTGVAAGKRFSLGGAMLQNMLVEIVGSHSLSKNNHAKQQGSQSHHHSGLMVNSSGKKNMSSGPGNATNTQHIQSSPLRKPLSPLSSFSSNIASFNFQYQNLKSMEFQDTHNVCKTPVETTKKILSSMNENQTPKTMPIPVPTTPPTVSSTMQTTMSPFSPPVSGTEEVDHSC